MQSLPNYLAAHKRVFRRKGSATTYICVDCGKQAAEWSYRKDASELLVSPEGYPYSSYVEDYEPRCVRCHRLHDAGLTSEQASIMGKLGGSKGGTTTQIRFRNDPVFRREALAARSIGGKLNIASRRKCAGCPKVSTRAGIGTHQKYSGHVGYVDLEPVSELLSDTNV